MMLERGLVHTNANEIKDRAEPGSRRNVLNRAI